MRSFLPTRLTWLRFAPAALYLSTAAVCARRAAADGYDGVGFVLALQQLDLSRFAPQPPGYPLMVGLGRLVQAGGVPAAAALTVVSAALLGAGIGVIVEGVRRKVGAAAGLAAAVLLSLSPLCWALGVATLSDGAGLGALLLAAAVLARPGRGAAGLGGGLVGAALGIRPTYAPLAALLLLLFGRIRGLAAFARASLGALAAVAAWLIPFSMIVGPRALWHLSLAHATGHLTDFGGAVTAEPSPSLPIVALLRGLWESALGPVWPLALALVGWALVIAPPRTLSPPVRRLAATLLWGLCGYCLFALFALPLRGHARHLLPAVVTLLVLVAIVLGTALATADRRQRWLLGGASLLCAAGLVGTSACTLWAFRQPSPGVALAQYVVAHYPKGTLLYGARAARYLDLYWGSGSARPTLHFGNVIADAERLDHLPAEVLCTSEVRASAGALLLLRPLARFCYSPLLPKGLRLDPYADDCVELRAYRFRP